MKRLFLCSLAFILAIGVVAVPSADARRRRRPIPFHSCGTLANQARRTYRMTTGTTCAGGDGVTVSANNVTIDLGGFRLRGSGTGNGVVIAPNVTGTRIEHGTITQFGSGINAPTSTSGNVVDGIAAIQNGSFGILIGPGLVENSIVAKNSTGVDIIGPSAGTGVIRSTLATNNTSDGLSVSSTAIGLIDRSVSTANSNRGVFITAKRGTVRRTTVTGNAAAGIQLADSIAGLATRDVVTSNGQGILSNGAGSATGAVTVTRSTLLGNGKSIASEGLVISGTTGRITVTRNTVDSSFGDGISIPLAPATVDRNTANGNGWGMADAMNFGINAPNGSGRNHAAANDSADNQCVDDVLC